MDPQAQVRESLRWLEGLEGGSLPAQDLFNIADRLDPVIVSLMIRYLRKKYPSAKPESSAIIGRLVELSSTYPQVVNRAKDAETDPISEWFMETYSFGQFYQKPEEMVQLIIDKLEG
jgi:hypothetical protein